MTSTKCWSMCARKCAERLPWIPAPRPPTICCVRRGSPPATPIRRKRASGSTRSKTSSALPGTIAHSPCCGCSRSRPSSAASSRTCRPTPRTATRFPSSSRASYPGDLAIEERITSIIRWNALAMVVRANVAYGELGGHIASYASAAEIFEVGFNHFFRARRGTRRRSRVLPAALGARRLRARVSRRPADRRAARQLPPGSAAAAACPRIRIRG